MSNGNNTQEQEVPQTEVELNKDEIYQDAISIFGRSAQILVCIEEMAEFTKELIKFERGIGSLTHIAEELADVSIMLEQMAIAFNCHNNVVKFKRFKLARLKNTLVEVRGGLHEKQFG